MPSEMILIVDDAPLNLKLTSLLLRFQGYRVEAVLGGEQALALLGSVKPDMILTDIRMPEMDGYELTRLIKQDPRLKGIPVVAITASGEKGDELKAQEAGCDGYLTKPIDTRMITTKIREYLDRHSRLTAESAPSTPKTNLAPGLPVDHA